jgi:CRP-like cAMP-binding protein
LRTKAAKLFGSLDDLAVADLLDGSKCYFVQRGVRVVKQGDRGDSMYIVILGKLHVIVTSSANRGEPMQIATMLPGDFFGEIALMTGEERRATVMAPYEGDGNVWILEFSKRDVGSTILARPSILRALTDVCADRRLEKIA